MTLSFAILALVNVGLGFILAVYLARRCRHLNAFNGEE